MSPRPGFPGKPDDNSLSADYGNAHMYVEYMDIVRRVPSMRPPIHIRFQFPILAGRGERSLRISRETNAADGNHYPSPVPQLTFIFVYGVDQSEINFTSLSYKYKLGATGFEGR